MFRRCKVILRQSLEHLKGFYIRGSVHRNSKLKKCNEMQQYAVVYLMLNYSTYFGRPSRPSSGVYNTIVAASGTDRAVWGASFLKRDQISPYLVTFQEAVLLQLVGFIQTISKYGTASVV